MLRRHRWVIAAGAAVLAAAIAVPVMAASAATTAANPYGDPNLVSMFDGKSLAGWTASDTAGYVVKNGTIHTTGNKRGYLYYNTQVGSFRWIFNVKQTIRDHEPSILFWGTTSPIRDALSAIQFEPPNSHGWDYRPGHNNVGKGLFTAVAHTTIDRLNWAQCEIVGNQTTGVARMACCPLVAGAVTCKGIEVVQFKDPTAGRVGPIAIQVHNAGIQDEYKSLYIESPVRTAPDQFITTGNLPTPGPTTTATPSGGPPLSFEAEALTRTSAGTTEVVSETAASGGSEVKLNGTAAGDYVEVTVPNVPAGVYKVSYTYKGADTRGTVQASVNGVKLGSPANQYTAAATYGNVANLGSTTLKAGNALLRLTVTGKSTASRSYTASIDKITLTPA